VEHVLILINNKIIYLLLVLKKEKFINVQNPIIINFWIHLMHIIWLFIQYIGIHFIQKSLLVVQLIGLLKFGMLISSKNILITSFYYQAFLFFVEIHYLSMISVVLLVMLHGHLTHQLYLLHVQLMVKSMYLI
jgi:hypothetical protein